MEKGPTTQLHCLRWWKRMKHGEMTFKEFKFKTSILPAKDFFPEVPAAALHTRAKAVEVSWVRRLWYFVWGNLASPVRGLGTLLCLFFWNRNCEGKEYRFRKSFLSKAVHQKGWSFGLML